MNRIYLNNDWNYSENFSPEMLSLDYNIPMQSVRLPHTVAVTPFNSFSTTLYQKRVVYRRSFETKEEWKNKSVILTVEGAAHQSEIILNEKLVYTHKCGYTAFSIDLSPYLASPNKQNVLAIVVDSRENLNQPPFGYVIDYMTYGGIYRDVYIDIKNPIYISDVFVTTKGNTFNTKITLEGKSAEYKKYTIKQVVRPSSNVYIENKEQSCAEIITGISDKVTLTSASPSGIVQWNLDNPALYNLTTYLIAEDGSIADEYNVRFGFRDIRYDETGFYLNEKKVKICGLNRHQSWPYVGYAMPKNMQREDADILKYELGLNEVRTSHYPQSQYFVDRCDEIGLLVFTEIPGWQHIGNDEWKDIAVQNVRDMIIQYRNHPSIFIWGVRINESQDDDEFYKRTNALAHELDSTRPTGGVRFLRNSHLLEDVYTFNDFSFYGKNEGCLPKSKVTKTNKGYMITEYNGHMYPTKSFDCESVRTEHALRHAKVLDAVASHSEISGSSGWGAFDYNTHKDFGSGDYICYHGVMDMFRNPKLAAAVYKSQQEPSVVGDVLSITSSMDIGEYPGGARGDVFIITNASSVRMYVNNIFIKEYTKDFSIFKNLKHGLILIDDYIGHRLVDEDGIQEKYLQSMKDVLFALQKYGVDKLPLRYILKGISLWLLGVTNVNKLRDLYGKYIGNWGGESISYKFEAIREGKVVSTVIKSACEKTSVQAIVMRTQLIEEHSYDVVSIRLQAVDGNGNIQPYCNEAIKLSTEGCIELIGPHFVSLKGGMAGTFVKTVGTEGKGSLIIEDWQENILKIEFDVKVTKYE